MGQRHLQSPPSRSLRPLSLVDQLGLKSDGGWSERVSDECCGKLPSLYKTEKDDQGQDVYRYYECSKCHRLQTAKVEVWEIDIEDLGFPYIYTGMP